jgi:hypothetical protein
VFDRLDGAAPISASNAKTSTNKVIDDSFLEPAEASVTKDDKKYPYKVNFGRFLQRRMKRQRRKSNAIVTSHYTPLNWFPRSLFK